MDTKGAWPGITCRFNICSSSTNFSEQSVVATYKFYCNCSLSTPIITYIALSEPPPPSPRLIDEWACL